MISTIGVAFNIAIYTKILKNILPEI